MKPYGKQRWHDFVFETLNRFLDGQGTTTILEAGCGRECWISQTLRDQGRDIRVIGIDIDESSSSNPNIDEFHLSSVCEIPLEDDSVDVIISGYVIEHVTDPPAAFREMFRVLRPGGILIMWTPNIYNPIMIVSRFTSHKFHVFARRLSYGAEHADNAPTYYRLNTARKITAAAQLTGLNVKACRLISGAYSYFAVCKGTYYIACLVSKLSCLWPFSMARLLILCVFEKPAEPV